MIKATNDIDQRLLNGILNADSIEIKRIYDLILPSVIVWVKENRGSEADARDIFQEALIALFRKVENGNFQLTCTLKSFVRIMCRNLWLTRLRDNKKFEVSELENIEKVDLDQDLTARLERSEREQLFYKHFDLLGKQCRKIMMWFFDKITLSEIAKRLDTSENYIKKRKFICKEKLVKAVQNDPAFSELRNPKV
jgi:RNA polymerase sigma factor (sigma-70 family)